MRLDIAAVNHQPLQVGVAGQGVQELSPSAIFLPITEAIVDRTPVSVVLGQVVPGCAGAENLEHGVAEATVVPGGASHFAGAAREERFQYCPGAVGRVVAVIGAVIMIGDGLRFSIAGRAILAPNPQFSDTLQGSATGMWRG